MKIKSVFPVSHALRQVACTHSFGRIYRIPICCLFRWTDLKDVGLLALPPSMQQPINLFQVPPLEVVGSLQDPREVVMTNTVVVRLMVAALGADVGRAAATGTMMLLSYSGISTTWPDQVGDLLKIRCERPSHPESCLPREMKRVPNNRECRCLPILMTKRRSQASYTRVFVLINE